MRSVGLLGNDAKLQFDQRADGLHVATTCHRIEHITLGRKTEVLRRVVRCLDVMTGSRCDFRGSLAIDSTRSSTVDGTSIHVQPGANLQKDLVHIRLVQESFCWAKADLANRRLGNNIAHKT